MIKLILFDLDGTLVNSSVDITNALNYAIAPSGLEKVTVEKTIGMVGEGLTKLIEKVVGEEKRAMVPEVVDRFLSFYSEHLADFTLPYTGVKATLARLAGYRKAVISNKRELLSERLLDKLGLAVYFDAVLGSDSVDERKPSPKPIFFLIDKFSVRPEETIIVGDSAFDIEAGRAAGIRTVAVTYGFGEKELIAGADFVIDKMEELAGVLDSLRSNGSPTKKGAKC